MKFERYLAESAKDDPTWDVAREICSNCLLLPGPMPTLMRTANDGTLDRKEFVKSVGLTGFNPTSLLVAANVLSYGDAPTVQELDRAVEVLGLRYSASVLAVSVTVRLILKKAPQFGWRGWLENLIAEIEVGDKFGARAGDFDSAAGVVVGLANWGGLGVLMAHNNEAYKDWFIKTSRHGKVGRKILIELFGCEPYQVSAMLIQQLGFGPVAAFGIALGLGNLNPKHIDLGEDVTRWRAATQWVQALREGRNYPANEKLRNFFAALRPPKPRMQKNPVLETLYTEIARLRREGSALLWHLPKRSYEETKQAYGLT